VLRDGDLAEKLVAEAGNANGLLKGKPQMGVEHRESTAGPLAKLLLIVIPVVGVLMPLLILSALAAATVALWRWRAERELILETPEAKELN
jgi:hypothetical protein